MKNRSIKFFRLKRNDNLFNQTVIHILNIYDNHSSFENVHQDQVFVSIILIEMGK